MMIRTIKKKNIKKIKNSRAGPQIKIKKVIGEPQTLK